MSPALFTIASISLLLNTAAISNFWDKPMCDTPGVPVLIVNWVLWALIVLAGFRKIVWGVL